MFELLRAIRFYLIPVNSRQEKVYHAIRVLLLSFRLYGLRVTVRQILLITRNQSRDRRAGREYAFFYTYLDWIRQTEPGQRELTQQQSLADNFPLRPLISILTPVYNPDPQVLRETIQAVQQQTYPEWELILVNASTHPEVREVIDHSANSEKRIRPLHLERNLGIAENTNQALKLSLGEFILLMDHDDLISPNTLFEVVKELNEKPQSDLVYYDEDKVSADGKSRRDPWFKPSAFSPDLLISNNYLMHAAIRKGLVEELGGFDPSLDGAQDWDLSLKIVEHTQKIVHIPKVLYHWRQVEGSAARDANAKPWAFSAQEQSIRNALDRRGYRGVPVSFEGLGVIRVHWPTFGERASIIIPTRNNLHLLRACLTSILEKTSYQNFEVLLVDNNSMDPEVFKYYRDLETDPRIRIIEFNNPFNYHSINNFAVKHATGDVLVFLNNDTEVLSADWLDELVGQAMRPEVGAVGTKLLRQNGEIQHAGMIVGLEGHASHIFEGCPEHYYGFFGSTDWYRNYQSVTGACMAIRKDMYERVDGFDESYIVGYGDIDLCFRLVDVGLRIIYTPFARLLHHEGGTRGLALPPSDVLRATVLMHDRIQAGDPFYNPNLSYLSRQPALGKIHEETRADRLIRILRDFDLIALPVNSDDWESSLLILPLETRIPRTLPANQVERILLVTHELSLSGAPIILSMIAQHLKAQGYDLKVISPADGPLGEHYSSMGVPVVVVPRLLDDARTILFHMDDRDTLLVNTILAWRAIHAARAFNRRSLWWIHESTFGHQLAKTKASVSRAFQAADLVMFPSMATANLYREFTDRDNFRVAYSGLRIDRPVDIIPNPKLKKRKDELFLVQVATFERRKGQDILLEAMSRLSAEVADHVHLFLIGRKYLDRRYYRKISQHARQLKNVTIVGELSNLEVWDYLNVADVFVLASRDEALPISMIEAMAIGKAIIATAAGGINEIIQDEVNGFVVGIDDSQGLADRITQLIKEPETLRRLGNQARRTYQERLSMDEFGRRVQEIIEELPQP